MGTARADCARALLSRCARLLCSLGTPASQGGPVAYITWSSCVGAAWNLEVRGSHSLALLSELPLVCLSHPSCLYNYFYMLFARKAWSVFDTYCTSPVRFLVT